MYKKKMQNMYEGIRAQNEINCLKKNSIWFPFQF